MNPILPEPDVSSLYVPPPPGGFAPQPAPRSTEIFQKIHAAVGQVFVGQEEVLQQVLAALLAGGHVLLEGKPGLGKTHLVLALSHTFGGSFRRIQFTPDLMPTDILGSEILMDSAAGGRAFQFVAGPIFTNLLLADEINRTPPKTQAALLEAMQEKQVTVAGKTRHLDEPFLVFATQNPIEHEGTYPLPEAQLDRFFFDIRLDYPSLEEEAQVIARTTGRDHQQPSAVTDARELMELQEIAIEMPLPDNVVQSVLKLTHMSRPTSEHADDYVKKYVGWGAGPRASQTLVRAARALALLRGKAAASMEEVRAVAAPVLRHRILPNYNATGDDVNVEQIIAHLVKRL